MSDEAWTKSRDGATYGADIGGTKVDVHGQRETVGGTGIINPFFQKGNVAGYSNHNNKSTPGIFGGVSSPNGGNGSYPTGTRIESEPFVLSEFLQEPMVVGGVLTTCLASGFMLMHIDTLLGTSACGITLGIAAVAGSVARVKKNNRDYAAQNGGCSMPLNYLAVSAIAGAVEGEIGGVVGMFAALLGVSTFAGSVVLTAQSRQTPVDTIEPQRRMPSHHTALLSVAPC